MRFIGAACVAAMLFVAACRQPGPPAPLRERPETALPAETAWLLERMKEVEQMTTEARAALESNWFRAPGDLRTAEQLLLVYAQNASNDPAGSRETRLRHRQRLILWFIDMAEGVHEFRLRWPSLNASFTRRLSFTYWRTAGPGGRASRPVAVRLSSRSRVHPGDRQ